jgi:hypothetical protein
MAGRARRQIGENPFEAGARDAPVARRRAQPGQRMDNCALDQGFDIAVHRSSMFR